MFPNVDAFCNEFGIGVYANSFCAAVASMRSNYKKENFGKRLAEHNSPHKPISGYSQEFCEDCLEHAYLDFREVVLHANMHSVYELISIFAKNLILEAEDAEMDKYRNDESIFKDYVDYLYSFFDEFKENFNDTMRQFEIDVQLTRLGIMPRQDEKIIDDLIEPVLRVLSDTKWVTVNRELADAISDFRLGTNESYSSCITHTVSAVQGFLQVHITGETGKGEISKLINEGLKKGKLPNDIFSSKILKDIESILMTERQDKGDAHPKKEYSNEKSARLILNLAFVFIQHCLT